METPITILKQYWKHAQFRPLQEEIVNAVISGQDTLALLPTGGGKSVCFQVPALLRDGICIVITPLIALMNDQVDQLKARGIPAIAIHSGMSYSEIDILLDNCVYGSVKFLYVSPERLQTDIFIARVKKMKVGLIAVDEAHCISQWGYDFRPPYLKIKTLRELIPEVPIIALTATATLAVRDDIMDKLGFDRARSTVFQKSFARDNLSFVVRKTENKDKQLYNILTKVKGSAIIYVRSRKATQRVAEWLFSKKITSTFYHAGLSFDERTRRQKDWIDNKYRVMVATNAFGMGIDKPDVRIVLHLDLPENLESYYQEAGRGGRDGLRAYAVILYQDADILNLKLKTEQSQPTIDVLKKIYQALANYYQLALGSSEGQSYDFDFQHFTEKFNLHAAEVYSALKKLEEEGLIQFNESYYSASTVHISMEKTALYAFQVANERFDALIKMILRLFGGDAFSGFAKISESYLAKAMKISAGEIVNLLKQLHDLNVIIYQQKQDKPQITFILPRQDSEALPVDKKRLDARRELLMDKMISMTDFVVTVERCRMQLVQNYFNEESFLVCGICDVCIAKRKKDNTDAYNEMCDEVRLIISKGPLTVEALEEKISPTDRELFVDIVRELVETGEIEYDTFWKLTKTKQNGDFSV